MPFSRLAPTLGNRQSSPFPFPRGTRRGWRTLSREPGFRLFLRDDGEDFDRILRDVIEHPDLTYPEAVLGPILPGPSLYLFAFSPPGASARLSSVIWPAW